MKPPQLLLIDDSPADLSLLAEMMAHQAMRIHAAGDGEDGFNKAVLVQPDLILLDLVMPKMDGFATCRLLKHHPKTRRIPILFLSAANEVDKRIEGLTLGAVDFIGKPFVEEEVIARVRVHLNLARERQAVAGDVSDPCSETRVAGRDLALLEAAITLLRQALQHPPHLTQLSRQLGCNEKRLNQVFQEHLGMTVFVWIREERLRQARNLLLSTAMPIATIAAHLGYSSQANFAKAFRERFGCSARELRHELHRRRTQVAAPDSP